MGLCISAIEAVDDSVNNFLDHQSRYYKESKLAKEHLAKQNNNTTPSTSTSQQQTNNDHNINSVLQSELSPVYPSLPKAAQKYHCKSVYDGDTLTLNDGSKVRLLGIDTPEIKEKQPFALEAKEYTKKYCHEKDIWLTFQEPDGMKNEKNKDHYGRLLAFIWVQLDSTNNAQSNNNQRGRKRKQQRQSTSQYLCINEGVIASGLAHQYSPSKSKKVHNHDKLLGLQKYARQNKLGQWKKYVDYQAIVTPTGGAFHKCKNNKTTTRTKNSTSTSTTENDCKFLARSKNLKLVSVSDAYDRGLHPCRNCFG